MKTDADIAKLGEIVEALPRELQNNRWLKVAVLLKRMEDLSEQLRTVSLIGEINREWLSLLESSPDGAVALDGAALKKYSYPVKYEYPPAIVEAESNLKKVKKAAEADGSAKKISRQVDPEKDTLFTITV